MFCALKMTTATIKSHFPQIVTKLRVQAKNLTERKEFVPGLFTSGFNFHYILRELLDVLRDGNTLNKKNFIQKIKKKIVNRTGSRDD